MDIVEKRNIFFLISGAAVVVSLFAIVVWGIHFGIDFTGGSLLEIRYSDIAPEPIAIKERVETLGFGDVIVQRTDETGVIIRMKDISEEERLKLSEALSFDKAKTFTEERFTSIGPSVGAELKRKAIIALVLTLISIIIFVAFAFRKVSEPVSSWKYGLVAIFALVHDVTIPTGVMALLGKFYGVEADALFVTALLATLGISVNDTIVVFDRIREHLSLRSAKKFKDTVSMSLNQTITRSVNTSVTTLLALLALYVFGPEATKTFALILSIGLIVGTYSSIFIASPLLVVLERFSQK